MAFLAWKTEGVALELVEFVPTPSDFKKSKNSEISISGVLALIAATSVDTAHSGTAARASARRPAIVTAETGQDN